MIAAFVPIEMLCWLVLVETKSKYTVKQLKKMQADEKMTEMLSVCNIPDSIPGHLRSLREAFGEEADLMASTVLAEIRNAI